MSAARGNRFSPLQIGAVIVSEACEAAGRSIPSFSPLQIGAVIVRVPKAFCRIDAAWFQSPSDRGSYRKVKRLKLVDITPKFQSPSDRGSYRKQSLVPLVLKRFSFSPLQIGAVIVRNPGQFALPATRRFSPLQIGAVIVRSANRGWSIAVGSSFSPLQIGAVIVRLDPAIRTKQVLGFSPLQIGAVIVRLTLRSGPVPGACFSPLQIGAVIVREVRGHLGGPAERFSPLQIGAVIVRRSITSKWRLSL